MGKCVLVIRAITVVELESCSLKILYPISFDIEEIVKGRLLKIQACFGNVKLILINVYAPTVRTERVIFLNILKQCDKELF